MTVQITFDVSQIEKFERKILEKIKFSAFPLAIKSTLNTLAFTTMKTARETIREDFINRNKFTERSIRVKPVKTLKIIDMVATVGSTADYMEAQEEGETRTSKGKHGLRIPTGAAAGQSQLFPRRKSVKKRFRRGQIKLANESGRINAMNKKQFILMSIRVAALRGQSPFVFLPFGGRKTGLYKVKSKGKPGFEKLQFIHSFAHKSITIKPTRWLSKNTQNATARLNDIFVRESDRIFDRLTRI